jgi:hypothetical protein
MEPYGPTNASYLDDTIGEACMKHYFTADETNYPTRATAKTLTLELHVGGPAYLSSWLARLNDDDMARQLKVNIALYMRHCTLSSLLKHLRRWARKSALAHFKGSCSWQMLAAEIDWLWVVRRLRRELELHGKRADHRASELHKDKPWEYIEAETEAANRSMQKLAREAKRRRSR